MRAADSIYSPDFTPWPAKRSVSEGAVCHLAPCCDNNHHLCKFLKLRLTWENADSWPWAFTVPAAKQLANETISKSELNPHPYTCTLCTGQCIKKLDHHFCKYCKKKTKILSSINIKFPIIIQHFALIVFIISWPPLIQKYFLLLKAKIVKCATCDDNMLSTLQVSMSTCFPTTRNLPFSLPN